LVETEEERQVGDVEDVQGREAERGWGEWPEDASGVRWRAGSWGSWCVKGRGSWCVRRRFWKQGSWRVFTGPEAAED
jgi:hypothetical protein